MAEQVSLLKCKCEFINTVRNALYIGQVIRISPLMLCLHNLSKAVTLIKLISSFKAGSFKRYRDCTTVYLFLTKNRKFVNSLTETSIS